MKNNLIHLVVMEWEYEAERGVDIKPFSELKEAENYFEQLIETEKSNSWIKDINSLAEEVEDRSYYAYDEDGEAQTHIHITLQSKKI